METDRNFKTEDGTDPPVYRHESLDSTNSEALRLGEAGAPHLTAVVADYQTAGRGKLQSPWYMPAGTGVALSVLYREMPPGVEFSLLTLHVGRRLRERLQKLTGLKIDVKEPNDLLIDGKKVAGILSEARWRGQNLLLAVVGVGVNVNVREFPEELASTASSLALVAGRDFDVEEIAEGLIAELRAL